MPPRSRTRASARPKADQGEPVARRATRTYSSLNIAEADQPVKTEDENGTSVHEPVGERASDTPVKHSKRASRSKLSDVSNRRAARTSAATTPSITDGVSRDPSAGALHADTQPDHGNGTASADPEKDLDEAARDDATVADHALPGLPSEPLASAEPSPACTAAPTVAPQLAPTAHDLAAAARQAAIQHAAKEKERERELAGKPRLVIHQLVLENFKSYRGREVIGPFHKSFSAIVGPNGSGKSNTIDALLFVFGYRATKMRQGKLSELIHNSDGAANHGSAVDAGSTDSEGEENYQGRSRKDRVPRPASIDSCTVEVWFREIIDQDGRDAYTTVPDSELIVARTATRQNTSHYTINGRTSSFTEVTTLLKDRGIDLDHKRFLILQGEVESIAQMKPKSVTGHDEGLLEYLEDIIGTSHYKGRIEEALAQVELLNEARQTQVNRVKLSEREKASLEERKKDADQYLRDQNELAECQATLWQRYIWEADRNSAEYQAVVDEAKKTLKEEVESQADIKAKAEAFREEYNALQADTEEARAATAEVVRQLTVLEKAEVQLAEKQKALSVKMKKAAKSIADDKRKKGEAEGAIKNEASEIERLNAETARLEESLSAEEYQLEQIRDALKDKTEVFSNQIEALEVEAQPSTAELAAKRSEIELVRNERDLLLDRQGEEQRAMEELTAAIVSLQAEREAKRELTRTLEKEKTELAAREKELIARCERLNREQADLKRSSAHARQRVDEARASQAASKAQGGVLDNLSKLRDQGRLPGFHGRLGSLATIPDKYDVAISTACGGLDNLVVETIETGQKCIEYLRKHQLGRAQIMCLDKISKRDMSRINTPDNAPRLFDLLRPVDDKFLPAFYQLLTNTLVADTLEHGKRLAFGSGKRWRVVTLDGQLIDTSGTMSGGGNRPQKGKMSSKVTNDASHTPQMIAKCEAEFESASVALQKHSDEYRASSESLRDLQKRLPELEVAVSKAGMDIDGLTQRLGDAEKRLKALGVASSRLRDDQAQLTKLGARLAIEQKEEARLVKQCDVFHSRIQALQEKILEVGGVKLRSQQSKVSDLRARIEHNLDRTTKAEVGLAKATKDVERLVKAIAANDHATASCQDELQDVDSRLKATLNDKNVIQSSVDQAQEVLAEKSEELLALKATLAEQEKGIALFKKRQFDLEKYLSASVKALEESNKALRHWTVKLEALSWNDLDSDDEGADCDDNAAGRSVPRRQERGLPQLTYEDIEALNDDSLKVLKGRIAAAEERIANCQLDLSVLKEYERREKEFMQRAADLEKVTLERDDAKKQAEELRSSRLREFMAGFGVISMKLKEMYQMITLGGNAELELVDSLDPFSEGIIFSVMPPKKSWKNISNLSGGEKTLSSLALVFALHVYKPTPLYFMDEIDAALDFRNVSIVANYIRDRTKHAQFIIISLRNNMFELSSRLVGIYKVANQTRSIAIDNRELGSKEEEITEAA